MLVPLTLCKAERTKHRVFTPPCPAAALWLRCSHQDQHLVPVCSDEEVLDVVSEGNYLPWVTAGSQALQYSCPHSQGKCEHLPLGAAPGKRNPSERSSKPVGTGGGGILLRALRLPSSPAWMWLWSSPVDPRHWGSRERQERSRELQLCP